MKNAIFRSLCLILVLLFAVSSAACGKTTPPEDSGPTQEPTEAPTADPTAEPTPESNKISVLEYLEKMSNSIYTVEDEVDGDVGFTDSADVGIVKERFENEVLYPVPDDGAFAHIYKVADYGITPENKTDNAAKLNALLNDLKSVEGLKKVVFEPAVYVIETTVSCRDLKDLYICSSDSEKNFELRYSTWCVGIYVNNCDNIHFNNYDMDYDPSPTIAGQVIAYNKGTSTVTLSLSEEFDLTHPQYGGAKLSGQFTYVQCAEDDVFGGLTPDKDGVLPYGGGIKGGSGSYDAEKHEFSFDLTTTSTHLKVGHWVSVSFTCYNCFGFEAVGGGSVYLEHVNVYTTGGMAFHASSTEAVYMNHYRLDLREGSSRLMTSTADANHTCDIGRFVVTNSVFQYSHDDAFNVKNSYKTVKGVSSKKIVIGATSGYKINPGDELLAINEDNMEIVGTYTAVSVEYLSGSTTEITVKERVDETIVGCLFANASTATKLTLENNLIGNKRNRGILFQSRDSVIRHNTWRNIIHGVMNIFSTGGDQWNEGIMPSHVVVEKNKFLNNATAGISIGAGGPLGCVPDTIVDIHVNDNFFAHSTSGCISMSSLGDSEACRNVFYDICLDCSSGNSYAIKVSESNGVTVEGNRLYQNEKKAKYGFPIKGDGADVNAKDNKKIEVKE